MNRNKTLIIIQLIGTLLFFVAMILLVTSCDSREYGATIQSFTVTPDTLCISDTTNVYDTYVTISALIVDSKYGEPIRNCIVYYIAPCGYIDYQTKTDSTGVSRVKFYPRVFLEPNASLVIPVLIMSGDSEVTAIVVVRR